MKESGQFAWESLLPFDKQLRAQQPNGTKWTENAEFYINNLSSPINDPTYKSKLFPSNDQLHHFDYRKNIELGLETTKLRQDILNYADYNHISLDSVSLTNCPPPLQYLILSFHEKVNLLTAGNLKLVIKYLSRYQELPPQDREDLLSAGIQGLIRAATRYDPWHGIPENHRSNQNPRSFSTLAFSYIRSSVNHELQNIFGNGSQRAGLLSYLSIKQEQFPDLTPPTHSGKSIENISKARKFSTYYLSGDRIIHQFLSQEDNSYVTEESSLGDLMDLYVADLSILSVEDQVEKTINIKQSMNALNLALDTLTPIERRVISLRFFQNKTLEESGDSIGFTRERARQIEARAFRNLRRSPVIKRGFDELFRDYPSMG